ncbi:MAG TPA: peptide-methionine (S)-S-oxide reductase MsrA [Gammaproteobacteria bacterium]|nr:peptide-methionine (S)-S-oxide reductase MsrA [Gammaproteobacteria bacterium]
MFASQFAQKARLVSPDEALPGRGTPMPVPDAHFVSGRTMTPPYPEGLEVVDLGLGCFWGAERRFWQTPGVWVTAAGYAGGFTPNPDYKEVCSGRTGHAEVVRVVFAPRETGFAELLRVFWEAHDPTQGMRQGGDVGTQYRSVILTHGETQRRLAEASRDAYQQALAAAGRGTITTEIRPAPQFYFAEDYHQQYLAKNPGGYCGLGGTGVTCPA